jgi:hypothetical protein
VAALLCAGLNSNAAMAADDTDSPGGAPNRGGSIMSEADQAEIARLNDLPPYKTGLGDRNPAGHRLGGFFCT